MAEYSKYSRGPGDSILALLEPGEYVLNRNAVDDIGEEKLDEINFEDSPRFDMSQRSNLNYPQMKEIDFILESQNLINYQILAHLEQ